MNHQHRRAEFLADAIQVCDSDADVFCAVYIPPRQAPGERVDDDEPGRLWQFLQRNEQDNPESLARRFYRDLREFERLPEGGHFADAEVPEAMADRVLRIASELHLQPGDGALR